MQNAECRMQKMPNAESAESVIGQGNYVLDKPRPRSGGEGRMKKVIRIALSLFVASVVIGPGQEFLGWIC
jgi:hypothetical protein